MKQARQRRQREAEVERVRRDEAERASVAEIEALRRRHDALLQQQQQQQQREDEAERMRQIERTRLRVEAERARVANIEAALERVRKSFENLSVVNGEDAGAVKAHQSRFAKTVWLIEEAIRANKPLLGRQSFDSWTGSLRDIKTTFKDLMSVPNGVIGFVGQTSTGKTTLINALLGIDQLMPKGALTSTTTTAIKTRFWRDGEEASKEYIAVLDVMTEAEWKKELDTLIDAANSSDLAMVDVAHTTLSVVFGSEEWTAIWSDPADAFARSNVWQQQLGDSATIRHKELEVWQADLRPFIAKDVSQAEERANWPFIKRVEVRYNFEMLRGGVSLVDLPGTMDSNSARGKIAEKYMSRCSGIVLCGVIDKGKADAAVMDIAQRLLPRVLQGDVSMVIVGTKQENINVDGVMQIARNLATNPSFASFVTAARQLKAELDANTGSSDAAELATLRITRKLTRIGALARAAWFKAKVATKW
jgi:GTPase SAR1 family protein